MNRSNRFFSLSRVILIFTGARQPRALGLSSPKKTNQKKRAPRLGILNLGEGNTIKVQISIALCFL